MFFSNLLPLDVPTMENFIKNKVREIVNVLYKDNNGLIPKSEVGFLVRYFLQFPSQTQVTEEIIPEIIKLETVNSDKPDDVVKLDAFERHLIVLLKTNLYVGHEKEMLFEAFRILDGEKNGYIDLHTFYSFVKSYGVSFTKEQISDMEKFLLENETEFLEQLEINQDDYTKKKHTQTTTRKFYYEAYIRKVTIDNTKHFQELIKEYKQFSEESKTKIF